MPRAGGGVPPWNGSAIPCLAPGSVRLARFSSRVAGPKPSADLWNANLRHASLEGADLREADLRGADLTGTDLEGAILTGARVRQADVNGRQAFESQKRALRIEPT
jgi:hypothetical protein